MRYIAVLKEKIAGCGKVMTSMVKFLKENGVYEEYKAAHGEPEIPDAPLDDDEEVAEENTYSRLVSVASMRGSFRQQRANNELPTAEDMIAEQVLSGEVNDPNCPAAVQAVKTLWKKEEIEHRKAAERELNNLRLRHIQELQEAKDAGLDEAKLDNLRRLQEEELLMMKEQSKLLHEEILRQKEKEEVQALLSSAMDNSELDLSALLPDDRGRIGEMVSHLQATCESKVPHVPTMHLLCAYYTPTMHPLCALHVPILHLLCTAPTMHLLCTYYTPTMVSGV